MGNSNVYNPSIGYLKALGIVLMVLGHSGNSLHVNDFIYMFHMPLFFIASGYCFKDKYLSEPIKFFRNKVKGLWWPYVKWSLLFLILHNVFFLLNIYNDQYGYQGNTSVLYSYSTILDTAIVVVTKMHGAEQLLGGYWFLNALFLGSLIAWLVVRYVKIPLFGGAILLCLCTIFNKTCWQFSYFQISAQAFTAALLIVIGYALARYKVKTFKLWQILVGLAITLVGSMVWYMPMNQVSYSNKRFLPYIISATIATWCFYSLFKKMEGQQGVIPKLLEFVGKHTLTILTWHFLAFKLVSLVIIGVYSLPIARLAEFPVIFEYSERGWWLAYFITAMLVTCGIAYCNKWIDNYWLKL